MLKPTAPRSAVWDKVRVPDMVSRVVFVASLIIGICLATSSALLYIIIRWLFLPSLPLEGAALFAAFCAILGYSLGLRGSIHIIHSALSLPDDHD